MATFVPHLKSMLGLVLNAIPWTGVVCRDKFLVTAFHRVNRHTLDDGMTCSPETFRSTCIWLSRNFDVVSLADQVCAIEEGRSLSRTASITFDDGYLDNYEIAAPILLELGLPATFFVTTEFIASHFIPPWDSGRSTETAWMTWDHLRELARHGFDVESHTCTHIDLAKAEPESARAELRESLAVLTSLLGERRRMFAYPFGGVANMTEGMRNLVREEGYRCCVSCHGGLNTDAVSPYELRRMPLNEQYRSERHLAWEVFRASVEW